MEKEKDIVVVAGEASGDSHAADLIQALKDIDGSYRFSGLGGPKMAAAGADLLHDMTKLSTVGFLEAVAKYPAYRKIFYALLQHIKERRPCAVIFVDFGAFNIRLAEKLHGTDCKKIYYISPQVWASREKRVEKIKRYIDKMIVLFPFEKEFYAGHGVDVEHVGHPLVDKMRVSENKESLLKKIGLDDYKLTIGLLPGSRESEVRRHLPVMRKTAEMIKEEFPMTQFITLKSPTLDEELYQDILGGNPSDIRISHDNVADTASACNICLTASGTATLELALLDKPMAIMYKTSLLTWLIARRVVKVPYIGMVNLIAQKEIVPEFVQYQARPDKITEALKKIFTDEIRIAKIKDDLAKVRESLGEGGASRRAAEAISKTLEPSD